MSAQERIKCPYCGGDHSAERSRCPWCGTPNWKVKQYKPRRISGLRRYCGRKGINLSRLRIYLNEDSRRRHARGIYRDGREFVVYRNHADGSRTESYRGLDEARAVRLLYEKLCRARFAWEEQEDGSDDNTERWERLKRVAIMVLVVLAVLALAILLTRTMDQSALTQADNTLG